MRKSEMTFAGTKDDRSRAPVVRERKKIKEMGGEQDAWTRSRNTAWEAFRGSAPLMAVFVFGTTGCSIELRLNEPEIGGAHTKETDSTRVSHRTSEHHVLEGFRLTEYVAQMPSTSPWEIKLFGQTIKSRSVSPSQSTSVENPFRSEEVLIAENLFRSEEALFGFLINGAMAKAHRRIEKGEQHGEISLNGWEKIDVDPEDVRAMIRFLPKAWTRSDVVSSFDFAPQEVKMRPEYEQIHAGGQCQKHRDEKPAAIAATSSEYNSDEHLIPFIRRGLQHEFSHASDPFSSPDLVQMKDGRFDTEHIAKLLFDLQKLVTDPDRPWLAEPEKIHAKPGQSGGQFYEAYSKTSEYFAVLMEFLFTRTWSNVKNWDQWELECAQELLGASQDPYPGFVKAKSRSAALQNAHFVREYFNAIDPDYRIWEGINEFHRAGDRLLVHRQMTKMSRAIEDIQEPVLRGIMKRQIDVLTPLSPQGQLRERFLVKMHRGDIADQLHDKAIQAALKEWDRMITEYRHENISSDSENGPERSAFDSINMRLLLLRDAFRSGDGVVLPSLVDSIKDELKELETALERTTKEKKETLLKDFEKLTKYYCGDSL